MRRVVNANIGKIIIDLPSVPVIAPEPALLPVIGTWVGEWKHIKGEEYDFTVKAALSINMRGNELVVEEFDLKTAGQNSEKDKYTTFENNVLYDKQSTECGNWIELVLKDGKLKGHSNPAGGARPDCETKLEPRTRTPIWSSQNYIEMPDAASGPW